MRKTASLYFLLLILTITSVIAAPVHAGAEAREGTPASFDVLFETPDIWASSAVIAKNPDKMTYRVGESFDPAGMIVHIIWTRKDGTTKEEKVSNASLTISPEKFTKEGRTLVTLKTDGKVRKYGSYLPFTLYLWVTVGSDQKEHINRKIPSPDMPLLDPVYTTGTGKWVTEGSSQKFKLADGTYLTGWQAIDGRRYYFNEEGVLQTGWFKDSSGQWYAAYSDGTMAEGIVGDYCVSYGRWLINDIYDVSTGAEPMCYVLGDDGHRITVDGWYNSPYGDRFYIENGYGATGWYDGFLVENGKMVRNACVYAVKDNKDGYFVFDGKGKIVTTPGWFEDDNGQWYYIDQNGCGYTGWVKDQYISNGYLASGFAYEGNTPVIFDAAGRKVKNAAGLVYSRNGSWYFFLDDGTPYTGWLSNGRYCYDGKVAFDQLFNDLDSEYQDVYYVNRDGLVPGGWTMDIWGDWHYFTPDGRIYHGWLGDMYIYRSWLIRAEFEGEYIEEKIDGKTYRIDSGGHARRIS